MHAFLTSVSGQFHGPTDLLKWSVLVGFKANKHRRLYVPD
jgi:hypothetical protein